MAQDLAVAGATTTTGTQQLAITGGTIIDGTGAEPIENGVVLVADGRIVAVGAASEVPVPADTRTIVATGKFVIPGLLDAVNAMWFYPTLETLIRFEDRQHELFLEGAQIALRSGVTGMFSTWIGQNGARKARAMLRDGEAIGCRIYRGGNIIGFDGVFSPDLYGGAAPFVSKSFLERTNEEWERGTGRHLMWLPPKEVRAILRDYFASEELDYAKYAACGHFMQGDAVNAHFIAFSQRVQSVMVEEAHNAGLTMQSHTMSIESTDMSIEAGVDILTHGDISGLSTPYPEETIEKIVERGVAVGVLPVTQGNLEARQANKPGIFTEFVTVAKENRKNLIKAGALLQVGTECGALTKEEAETPNPFEDHTVEPSLHYKIGEAHFNAYLALEQEGMSGMDILKSATSNPARAYKLGDVGSLEAGKYADAVILDADPLESAANYRQIHAVIKGGAPVDRDALPLNPIITA